MNAPAAKAAALHGLVLAGGQSRRMGRDKASLVYGEAGETQAKRALHMLRKVCPKAFISLRPDQEPPSDVPPATPVIRDAWPESGPLGAILSAMDTEPGAAWFVLACDLPLLRVETLTHLAASRSGEASFLAYRSSHDGLPEPLCAIYEPEARSILHRYREAGMRCPRKILIEENAPLLEPLQPDSLDNANTPDDFVEMSRRLSTRAPRPLTVLYFGSLAAERGLGEETVESAARTPAELYGELSSRHSLSMSPSSLRVALNHNFAAWESLLQDKDVVAFLPPMAGG